MINHHFTLGGTALTATPTGALWIADTQTLCVSDLHLGKSGRIARKTGGMLPPYDTNDTLLRLGQDIAQHAPKTVICLGDSFDDLIAGEELSPQDAMTISTLQTGRNWIWIEGNHDPNPIAIKGDHQETLQNSGLEFRHIATQTPHQVSGHYHPKYTIKGGGPARACFLYDRNRLILPAYGTYTGGLSAQSAVLRHIFPDGAIAVLTGTKAIAIPVVANSIARATVPSTRVPP